MSESSHHPGQEEFSLGHKAALSLLVARVKSLAEASSSRIAVGLTGGPGVGKSTLATQIVESLNAGDPGSATFMPMDGFHMRHSKLEKLGTPHTFEGSEFVEFLSCSRWLRRRSVGRGARARSKTLWMTPSPSLRKQEFLSLRKLPAAA